MARGDWFCIGEGSEVAKPTRVTNCIRQMRADRGDMTQGELAERVGVTRQTINAIEKGKYSPSLEVAFQISGVLGRRLEEVFSYPEQRDQPQFGAGDSAN